MSLNCVKNARSTFGGELGRTPRGATARFLEGFLEGSSKEVLLRRVLRRRPVRVSIETEVLRRVLKRRGVIEGA